MDQTAGPMGYRLAKGKYQPIELDEQGALVSQELGLRLIPEEADLVLVDCRTGERLLPPEEAYESLQEVHATLEQERRKNAELATALKRLKGKKK